MLLTTEFTYIYFHLEIICIDCSANNIAQCLNYSITRYAFSLEKKVQTNI